MDENIQSIFNRRCLSHCCRCLTALCCLGSERLPALSTICLSGRLACVWAFVCTRLSKHFCCSFRCYCLCWRQFRNVLKHTEGPSSLACDQNIKEGIPTALEAFLSFETKRNDINRSSRRKTSTQRASNIRGRTGYNV